MGNEETTPNYSLLFGVTNQVSQVSGIFYLGAIPPVKYSSLFDSTSADKVTTDT